MKVLELVHRILPWNLRLRAIAERVNFCLREAHGRLRVSRLHLLNRDDSTRKRHARSKHFLSIELRNWSIRRLINGTNLSICACPNGSHLKDVFGQNDCDLDLLRSLPKTFLSSLGLCEDGILQCLVDPGSRKVIIWGKLPLCTPKQFTIPVGLFVVDDAPRATTSL